MRLTWADSPKMRRRVIGYPMTFGGAPAVEIWQLVTWHGETAWAYVRRVEA